MRCFVCGEPTSLPAHWFRGLRLCSGACNNMLMCRIMYHREKVLNRQIQKRMYVHHDPDMKENSWRGWIWAGKWQAGLEIHWGKWLQFGFGAELDSSGADDTVSAYIRIPGLSVYAGVEAPWEISKNVCPERGNRITQLYWIEDSFCLDIWHDNEDNTDKRHWYFSPKDALLGRVESHSVVVEQGRCEVPMPEGTYAANYKFIITKYERPRWFGWVQLSTSINIDQGIPFSGKGENSYDCGDDALYGTGACGHSVPAAVANAQKSVMKYRERYGMPSNQAFVERGMVVINDRT